MPIRKELGTIADLEAGARVIPIGSDLYRQGDICFTYFIVLNGWIALSVLLDDGSCQILDFALPGAILGFQQAPNAPMYHSARCLSVVRVYAFPRRKLDIIIETNPRLAILLCRQDELSYQNIAEVLGCSLSATKSLIHRGRETLKQKLKPYLRTGAWRDPLQDRSARTEPLLEGRPDPREPNGQPSNQPARWTVFPA